MGVTSTRKQELIKDFQKHTHDTGSAEIQISVLTERIKNLTEHLKGHVKDFSSRRGLLIMVGRRAALLKYVKRTAPETYKALITKLGIRK